jgi:glyoxylase I family protein
MTAIQGYHHLSLSVGDLERSAAWYVDVFGLEVSAHIEGAGFRRTRLRAPGSGITLALTQHDAPASGPFDERRIGMDHVAFAVGDAAAVHAVKARLEELGAVHSEVREPGPGAAALTLRDPDNIQLEVFGGPAVRRGES